MELPWRTSKTENVMAFSSSLFNSHHRTSWSFYPSQYWMQKNIAFYESDILTSPVLCAKLFKTSHNSIIIVQHDSDIMLTYIWAVLKMFQTNDIININEEHHQYELKIHHLEDL